jgi:hypothetical protein
VQVTVATSYQSITGVQLVKEINSFMHIFLYFFAYLSIHSLSFSFSPSAIPGYPNYNERAGKMLNSLNLKLPFETEGLSVMILIS